MTCMYNIAVLGDRDSILGFRALGLSVFFADTAEKAKPILHKLTRRNYAIIYITESLAAELKPEIDRYKDAPTPAIILIPGQGGSLGIGMTSLKDAVERAVGANIL